MLHEMTVPPYMSLGLPMIPQRPGAEQLTRLMD